MRKPFPPWASAQESIALPPSPGAYTPSSVRNGQSPGTARAGLPPPAVHAQEQTGPSCSGSSEPLPSGEVDPSYFPIAPVHAIPEGGGVCALVKGKRVAIFHLLVSGEPRYFAVENRCPHWGEEVLWRGLTGNHGAELTVACPLHKRLFSLETGACLSGDVGSIAVYPLVVFQGMVYVKVER